MLGNNQICKIDGVGSIKLRLVKPYNSIRILTEVRYIPEVKRNLISLGALEKKGYSFCSSGGIMTVGMRGEMVLQAERKDTLYYLEATVIKNGEINTVNTDSVKLWYMRLGHPAYVKLWHMRLEH